MFEWFPIFHGRYFTYQEYIFIFTIGTFSLIALISFPLGLYLNYSKRSKLKYSYEMTTKNLSDDIYESQTENTSGISLDNYTSVYAPNARNNRITISDPGTKGGNAAIWIGWMFTSLIPGSLAVFHIWKMPMWLAVLIDYSIIMTVIRYREKKDKMRLYHILQQKDKLEAYEVKSRPIVNFYKKMVLYVTIIWIALPVLFTNLCVSSFQDYVGPIFGDFSLSSQLTRFFQISKACPPGPPCHIYATLPEDASTGVFINVHTDESYDTISIKYDLASAYNARNILGYAQNSTSFEISGMENDGQRRVHAFYLNNLEPDSMYFFQIFYDGAVQASNYYRTLPGEDNPRDMVIVQGGDMGDTSASKQVTIAASQMNPDVVVLGGDLAYDNGMCTCYFAWDYFLRDLDEMNKRNGRLVPIITALGNHDAGLDSLNEKKMKVTSDGPFYMVFLPQHSSAFNRSQVPGLEERKSYHYHKFGKVLLINLDSGYLDDPGSEQLAWMRLVLDNHPQYLKLANYHCPMYWACKGHDSLSLNIVAAQKKDWLPVFDEYNFALAFENHEHHLKRTFSLRNNEKSEQGTVYIGNGQWGPSDIDECESYNQTGIYERTQNVHHYWVITVNYTGGFVENAAYGNTSNLVVPAVRQKLADYMGDGEYLGY